MRGGRLVCGFVMAAMVVPASARGDGPATGNVTPGWTTGASQTAARERLAAVRLNDGRVLFIGGDEPFGAGVLGTVDLYDPVHDTVTLTGGLVTPRTNLFAVTLANGKVLAGGGTSSGLVLNGTALKSTQLYDPATGTWSAAHDMLTAREYAGAVLLRDGRVFVAGGDDNGTALSSAELYDPATDTWSAAAPLTHAREAPGIALLDDGKVLVAGGITGGASGTPVPTSQVYDPVTNMWGPEANMTVARYWPTLTTLLNGKALAAGGVSGTGGAAVYQAGAELYNPATNGWTATGSMTIGRRDGATATRLTNGKVLDIGGSIADDSGSTADLYDPASGTWSRVPGSLNGPHAWISSVLLRTGQVAVGGATGGNSKAVNLYTAATTLSAPDLSLGDQQVGTTRAATPVTITNTGDMPLLVRRPALSGPAAADFALASDSCTGAPVAAGAACAFSVTFAPSAAGARDATLTVAANTATPSRGIALSGNGVSPPAVTPAATPVPPAPQTPAAPLKRFAVTLAFTFRAGPRATKLTSLSVHGVPAGSTVVARCAKGCAHKRVTKRNAARKVSLKALLKKPLKVGTRITVTISRPGYITQVKTLTIRARRPPRVTTRNH